MSNEHQHSTTSDNNTYRPRSPDLSAYTLSPQHHQQQPIFHPSYQESTAHSPGTTSWQHRQGSSAALTGLPSSSSGLAYPPATHRGSYDASPYFSPQGSFSQPQGNLFSGQHQQGSQQLQQRKETLAYGRVSSAAPGGECLRGDLTNSSVTAERYSPAKGFLQQSQRGHNQQPQAPVLQSSPVLTPQYQQHNMPPARRRRGQTEENEDSGDADYAPDSSTVGGAGRSSRKRKSDGSQTWTSGRAPGDLGPSLGIDVKTKFPVARIKRIMQADEDVGKVAQATPTAVCKFITLDGLFFKGHVLTSSSSSAKALELFMITLVTKAAAEARDRSSKRVTAAHLKQAVAKDQTLDFLQEIIEKVPDPTEKKGGRAGSEDMDDGGGGQAKRKRAPRGKKKADSDED